MSEKIYCIFGSDWVNPNGNRNVYRVRRGRCGKYPCHNLYVSLILVMIGTSVAWRWGGGIPCFKIMKIQLAHTYHDIISLENLLAAWQEFVVGKRKKKDVQEFSFNLMDNILSLHNDLATRTYTHGGYHSFFITDPKRRHIHKAGVRDRLLHHAVYRILYPFFDRTFIADSYHRVLRGATRRRMFDKIKAHATDETVASYLGLLFHGNTFRLQEEVVSQGWLWKA